MCLQVLTLEDWEIIMYSVIRQSNFGSTIYFVAWVVLGKYTFLTLFLAVTLEAFESKYDVEASSEAYLAYKSMVKCHPTVHSFICNMWAAQLSCW